MSSADRGRLHTVVVRRWGSVVFVAPGGEVASWPLEGDGRPDLGTVDDIARLQLAARRVGCAIHLRNVCPDLLALIELAGLSDELRVIRETDVPGASGRLRPPRRLQGK